VVGHSGRLDTITQKCVPVKTVSKWPMQNFKAVMLVRILSAGKRVIPCPVGLELVYSNN
jgi:hypothetical protein